MARKSRKTPSAPMQTTELKQIYKTGLYLRLSKENSGYEHHESIQMQEYLLKQYIQSQPDMEIVAVFRDNGASGTAFARPGFKQLMDAIYRREIDCVVVKDLSRLGRNYLETGYYLEEIFPFYKVRFVSINDTFDTLYHQNANMMAVSLKNIVNTLFVKDISRKTSSTLRYKQKNGDFIGSKAPYGYQKSPENKHQLIIDPKTAPIVIDIFTWRLEGLGFGAIAKKLNDQGIPSPSATQFLRGESAQKAHTTPCGLWIPATIKNITANMVYAGHMAQGKQVRSLYEGVPKTTVDSQDWLIVRETHAPIVTERIWNAVSSINQTAHMQSSNRRILPKTENLLVGLVFCNDCGKTMARVKNCSRKGTIRYTFSCRIRKASKGLSGCTCKNIGEMQLLELLLESLRAQLAVTTEQFIPIRCLTRKIVLECIHHIAVAERNDVHIVFDVKDPYETFLTQTKECDA